MILSGTLRRRRKQEIISSPVDGNSEQISNETKQEAPARRCATFWSARVLRCTKLLSCPTPGRFHCYPGATMAHGSLSLQDNGRRDYRLSSSVTCSCKRAADFVISSPSPVLRVRLSLGRSVMVEKCCRTVPYAGIAGSNCACSGVSCF